MKRIFIPLSFLLVFLLASSGDVLAQSCFTGASWEGPAGNPPTANRAKPIYATCSATQDITGNISLDASSGATNEAGFLVNHNSTGGYPAIQGTVSAGAFIAQLGESAVYANSAAGNNIRIQDVSGNPEIQLQYGTTGNSDHWSLYNNQADDSLRIWGGTADRFTILQTGNIGIGTASPSANLEVEGSFAADLGYKIVRLPRGNGATNQVRWYLIAEMLATEYWELDFELIGASHFSTNPRGKDIIHFYYSQWNAQAPVVSHLYEKSADIISAPGQVIVTDEADGYNRVYARVGRYGDAQLIVENYAMIAGEEGSITPVEFAQGSAIPAAIASDVIYNTSVDDSQHTFKFGNITADGTICSNGGSDCIGGGGWTDDGTVVRLTTITDRVGIGNNAPQETLDVTGTFRLQDGNQTSGYVLVSDANGTGTWAPVTTAQLPDTLWQLSGNNLFASSTLWNVGIGTLSPQAKLEIKDSVGDIRLSNNDVTTVTGQAIGNVDFWTGDNSAGGNAVVARMRAEAEDDFTGTALTFWTTESGGNVVTEQMRINEFGNVGIGTTNPNSKLHINTVSDNAEIDISTAAGDHWGMYQEGVNGNLRFWNSTYGDNVLDVNTDGSVRVAGTLVMPTGTYDELNYYRTFFQERFYSTSVRYLQFDTDLPGSYTTLNLNLSFDSYGGGNSSPHGTLSKFIRTTWNGSAISDFQSVVKEAVGQLGNNIRIGEVEVYDPGTGSSRFRIPIYTSSMGSGRWIRVTVEVNQSESHIGYFKDISFNASQAAAFPGSSYNTVSQRLGIGLGNNIMPAETLDVGGDIFASGTVCDTNGCIGDSPSSGGGWTDDGAVVRLSTVTDNVGIGTANANTKLQVWTGEVGTGDQEALRLQGNWVSNPSGPMLRFTNQHNSGTNPNAGEYNVGAIVAKDDSSNWGGSLYFQTVPSGTNGGGNLTDVMVLKHNGNVGIGTSAPNKNLHIYEESGNNAEIDIQSIAGANNHWGLYHDVDLDDLVFWQEADLFRFTNAGNLTAVGQVCDTNGCIGDGGAVGGGWTDDGTIVRLTTNTDNVGIGITNPNSNLHIYEESGNNAEIDIQSVAGANNHWGLYHDVDADDLVFWQEDDLFRFTNAGNLTAVGQICDTNGCIGSGVGTLDDVLAQGSVATHNTETSITDSRSSVTSGTFNTFRVTGGGGIFTGGGTVGRAISVTGGNMQNTGAISQALYVEGGQGVSYGAPTTYGLYVVPGGGLGTHYAAYFGGNVGIGTNAPNIELAIGDSDGPRQLFVREDTGTVQNDWLGQIMFDDTDGGVSTVDASVILRASASEGHSVNDKGGNLAIFTKPTDRNANESALERMRITEAGNVGIGVTDPDSELEINGQIKITGGSPSADRILTSDANGLATWEDLSSVDDTSYNSGVCIDNTWMRIATNSGNRADAHFTVRDFISSGGHSTMRFYAGVNFGDANGISFTLLNHSVYNSPSRTTFTQVRIVENGTYDGAHLDIYCDRAGVVDYTISDNNQSTGWTAVDWGAASIPSGWTSHAYNTDVLFKVARVDDSESFSVARNGDVSIGTTNPNIHLAIGDTDTGFQQQGDGQLAIYTNNVEKIRIEPGGNVGIGTSTPAYMLDVDGEVRAITYLGTSDVRLKKNIENIGSVIAGLEELQPVYFEWKEGTPGINIGLIAQDAEEVFPELVTTDANGYKSIVYDQVSILLLAGVQEQQAKIEKLEARIDKLEKALNNLIYE